MGEYRPSHQSHDARGLHPGEGSYIGCTFSLTHVPGAPVQNRLSQHHCRFRGEPEVEHVMISMPDTHAGILTLIHQTCQDILGGTPGANRTVAPADPSDTRMLEKAMTSAAELEGRVPGSQRMLLKAYTGIAVLRYCQ